MFYYMLLRNNRIKSEGAQLTLGYISPWETPASNRHEQQPQSNPRSPSKGSGRQKQRIIHQLQFTSQPRRKKLDGSHMMHTIGDFKHYMREMAKEEAGVATMPIRRQQRSKKESIEQLFQKKCITEFKNVAKVVSIGELIQFQPNCKQTQIMSKPMARPIPNLRKSLQASRKQPRPYKQSSDSRTKARSITEALVSCMKRRTVHKGRKETQILNKTLQSFLTRQHQV